MFETFGSVLKVVAIGTAFGLISLIWTGLCLISGGVI